MCASATEISPHKKSETTNLEATGSNQRRFERFDFFRKVAQACSYVAGSELSAKLKTCLQKLSSMENIQRKNVFTFFRLVWWSVFVFCWLLVAFQKQQIMKCLYLTFIYVYEIFGTWLLSQACEQKKGKLSLPKITHCLDAQADRPTTVKGRFLVKNAI